MTIPDISTRPSVHERIDTGAADWKVHIVRSGRAAPTKYIATGGAECLRYPPWESRYDVYLEHVGGNRIPMGTNLHTDPSKEVERLIKLVTGPVNP